MQPDTNQHVFYDTWKDKGGNIGVQCLKCNRTHWNGNEPLLDPTTGKDCENCKQIKESGILRIENEAHKAEENCLHKPSQP